MRDISGVVALLGADVALLPVADIKPALAFSARLGVVSRRVRIFQTHLIQKGPDLGRNRVPEAEGLGNFIKDQINDRPLFLWLVSFVLCFVMSTILAGTRDASNAA